MKRKSWIILCVALVLVGVVKATYAAPPPQSDNQSYVVQADDWLSKIADKAYGDVLAWPAIWLGTNAKAVTDESYALIEDPNVIEVGQKLWIPEQAEVEQWLQEYAALNATETPVLGQGNVTDLPTELGACTDATTQKIYEIQGDQDATLLVNQQRVITGVVTADFQGPNQFNGFFIQDPSGDGNEATSDGLFIFTPNLAAKPELDVAVGQVVRVLGKIQEFKDLTEMNALAIAPDCGTGSVSPISVNLPVASAEALERYEGMLVVFPQELSVTEHFQLGRFGEVVLAQGGRLIQPTQIITPGQPAQELQAQNDRRKIILDDGRSGSNLEPIFYPPLELTALNTLRGGDTVTNLTGILDYRFDSYRVQPLTTTINFSPANPRPQTPPQVGGRVKVASFNVLNYFTTIDPDPGDDSGKDKPADNICGSQENLECRGADSAAEFARQHDKIIAALLAIDADIVGLTELENNPTDSIQSLVTGLNDELGAGVYAFIDTGTLGTDAIKVGLIYKPGTVIPVGPLAILDSSVDPSFNDQKNRPVLAQTFAEAGGSPAEAEQVVVAISHLKSKGSDCKDVNDPDLNDSQGNCPETRKKAAIALAHWLADDPTATSTENILIIGDLNSQAREFSIQELEQAGYTNLVKQFIGDEAFSFAFRGQWAYLDYALANGNLLPKVVNVAEWHINADEPQILDYNKEFKSAAQQQSLYDPGPFRVSDHDPVIIGLFPE